MKMGVGGREENMESDLGGLDSNSMLFSHLPRSPSPMMQRFTQPLENVDCGYQRQQVSSMLVLLSRFVAFSHEPAMFACAFRCAYIHHSWTPSLHPSLSASPAPVTYGVQFWISIEQYAGTAASVPHIESIVRLFSLRLYHSLTLWL